MDQFKGIKRTLDAATEGIADVVLGYEIAPGPERAAVVAIVSFGATALAHGPLGAAGIALAGRGRTEASKARLIAASALMLGTGLAGALNRDDGQEARYAVPFGIGAGLALGEAPAASNRVGVVASALSLGGVLRDLHRRGAVHRAIRQLAGS